MTAAAALGRFRLDVVVDGAPSTLAAAWRGAVASWFPDAPSFHGHAADRTLYRYPPVQYRWVGGQPALFVLGEGVAAAMEHGWPGAAVRLGNARAAIVDVLWEPVSLDVTPAVRLNRYRFNAPWLPLNQENYARFRDLSQTGRRRELDRILVGNLLSTLKGIGIILAEGVVLYAAAEAPRLRRLRVNDADLVGVHTTFVTNLELPDHLSLGRAVSKGFGWFTGM